MLLGLGLHERKESERRRRGRGVSHPSAPPHLLFLLFYENRMREERNMNS